MSLCSGVGLEKKIQVQQGFGIQIPEGWGYSISKLVELVELLPKCIFEADEDIWIRIKEIFHGTKFKSPQNRLLRTILI